MTSSSLWRKNTGRKADAIQVENLQLQPQPLKLNGRVGWDSRLQGPKKQLDQSQWLPMNEQHQAPIYEKTTSHFIALPATMRLAALIIALNSRNLIIVSLASIAAPRAKCSGGNASADPYGINARSISTTKSTAEKVITGNKKRPKRLNKGSVS